MVALARKTLIYEWRRFLPAMLAVGFAGLLQLLQIALVLGIFGSTSLYITGSSADVWVGCLAACRCGVRLVVLRSSVRDSV